MAINFVKFGVVLLGLSLPLATHIQSFGGTIDQAGVEPQSLSVSLPDGLLAGDQRDAFLRYVIGQHRPSYQYRDNIRVGVVLPLRGVRYFKVPLEYGAIGYLYSVVNQQTVLVDPATQEIVQIVR